MKEKQTKIADIGIIHFNFENNLLCFEFCVSRCFWLCTIAKFLIFIALHFLCFDTFWWRYVMHFAFLFLWKIHEIIHTYRERERENLNLQFSFRIFLFIYLFFVIVILFRITNSDICVCACMCYDGMCVWVCLRVQIDVILWKV